MVILFAADQALVPQVSVNITEPVVIITQIAELDSATCGRARACAYATTRLAENAIEEIRQIQRKMLFIPLILVMPNDTQNAKGLKDVQVNELVWLETVGEELAPAMESVIAGSSVAARFAQVIESSPGLLHPRLRQALVDILRANSPVPSRAKIGGEVAYSPSRLSARLAGFFGGKGRPVTILKYAIRTLQAYDLVRRGCDQEDVLRALAIDRRALRRAIRTAAGTTFTELRQLPPEHVLRCAVDLIGLTDLSGAAAASDI